MKTISQITEWLLNRKEQNELKHQRTQPKQQRRSQRKEPQEPAAKPHKTTKNCVYCSDTTSITYELKASQSHQIMSTVFHTKPTVVVKC